jgi:hypothetical protein
VLVLEAGRLDTFLPLRFLIPPNFCSMAEPRWRGRSGLIPLCAIPSPCPRDSGQVLLICLLFVVYRNCRLPGTSLAVTLVRRKKCLSGVRDASCFVPSAQIAFHAKSP